MRINLEELQKEVESEAALNQQKARCSLHRAGRGPAWSASKAEEVLSALWLIAALLAWNGGIIWLAVLLFIKSAADIACSIGMAILEIRAESKQPPTSVIDKPSLE